MKEQKICLVEIRNNGKPVILTYVDSGNLSKDWEDAYDMRDDLQLQPINLNEQRFAVRWA